MGQAARGQVKSGDTFTEVLRSFKRSPGTFGNFADRAPAKQLEVAELSSLATLKTVVDVPKREARRGAPASKIVSEMGGKGLVRGDTGGMSLRRARTGSETQTQSQEAPASSSPAKPEAPASTTETQKAAPPAILIVVNKPTLRVKG